MKRIPIRVAKTIAEEFDLSQVIVLAFSKKTGLTHVVTYGQTIGDCAQAAEGGNKLKKVLGWPDELCHDTPARARRR